MYLPAAFAIVAAAWLVFHDPFRWASAREGGFEVGNVFEANELLQGNVPPNGALRIAVRVETDRKGGIKNIAFRDLDAAVPAIPLGSDVSKLKSELHSLRGVWRGWRTQLVFEVDGNLPYARVVELLDAAAAAGFEDVVPIVPED